MIQHHNGKGTWLHHARTLPYDARIMGLYLLGASRSGKSRMLGRVILWQDFIAERGQLVCDPRGVTISNFLDKLVRFLQHVPPDQHAKYWRRIRYLEISGKDGFITGLPLYYRLSPEESLAEISERYLQVIIRSNPHLADAQVFGWPPLHRIGLNAGIVLASLGCQITDMESLLTHPEQWFSRLAQAEATCPEAAPACAFFRTEYLPMRQADRARLTNSFRDKVFHFTLDPLLRAQFGAAAPGIDFEEVEAEGLTVLLDFRRETNPDLRRFKLLWLFDYFFHWIKGRGRRTQPLCLVFDEFSAMTQKVFTGENPLAQELTEFIQEYLRNSNIWLTVAHQSVEQLDDQLRNSLLSLGTYIFGRATMPEARILADVLYNRDPFRVKHFHKVWGKVDPPSLSRYASYDYARYGARTTDSSKWQSPDFPYYVLDTEPGEYMRLEEQQEEAANRIARLGRFQFLCRPARSEGDVSPVVFPMTIEHVDRDIYPEQTVDAQVRSLLAAQSGIPVVQLLAEQEARLPSAAARTPAHQPPQRQADSRIRHRERQQGDRAAPGTPETASAQPHTPPEPRHQRRRQIS
jgi:hypothetical protein